MNKWIKITLGVLGGLVALVAVALAALLMFFDPNDYKTQIDAAIQRQIGRPVAIDGRIQLSVFPWLGIKLGRVTIANAPGFGDQPMAGMNSAEVSVRLLPLFAKNLEIGTVSLQGLNLRLARHADGKTNWKDIVEHMSAEQNTPDDSADTGGGPGGAGGFKLNSLQIGAIDVQNAAISWQDAMTGSDYRARGVSVETGRLSDGEPFRLEAGGDLDARRQGVQASFHAVTKIDPNVADRFFRFAALSANVLVHGRSIPGTKQQANLSASGDFDWGAGRFKLDNLALQAAGLNMTGNVDGSGLHDQLAYSGRVTIQEFDPRAIFKKLDIKPPQTASDSVLSDASFDAQFNGGADGIEFKQVNAELDDSTLQGSARVKRFADPQIAFDLALDQLDLDDYMPPGDTGPAQKDESGDKSSGSDTTAATDKTEIDLSPLDGLNLDGHLTAGSLIARKIHVTNAELKVHADHGVLTIDPLGADLYGGRLDMTARVDDSRKPPRYALKGKLAKLQIAPLLAAAAGFKRLSGKGGATVDLKASGQRIAQLKRALSGTAAFDLRDGALNGFNLEKIIAAAREQIEHTGSMPGNIGVSKDASTPFRDLVGRFDIDRGVMTVKNMDLKTRDLHATGKGHYDIAANALDYMVDAKVDKQAPGSLSRLAGVTIPLKLSGPLLSPRYTVDVSRMARAAAGQRLNKEKSKLEDKLRDKLKKQSNGDVGRKIQQGISGFLGGGQNKDQDKGNAN